MLSTGTTGKAPITAEDQLYERGYITVDRSDRLVGTNLRGLPTLVRMDLLFPEGG